MGNSFAGQDVEHFLRSGLHVRQGPPVDINDLGREDAIEWWRAMSLLKSDV
jgi:hypothetical protein